MPSPTQTQESTPRVNLRHERERRSLTIKDIHIRVGIPLEHIEALESGVVPQALRGKKLLRSKQAYLSFLGYLKHSKLDVRRRRRRTGSGSTKWFWFNLFGVIPSVQMDTWLNLGKGGVDAPRLLLLGCDKHRGTLSIAATT